ncbi:hypothetical protein ACH3Y9_33925 [Streptomyces sp. WSLK1-5]|uniref:hypothetical protein n=1 Tax=unclassified Streptomyces TaxID=2593676 RepID=UPI000F64F386|nr:hypothetical protein [Streptomyces sp. RP5T]RRR80617.1 hypothetical protein EHS43_20915 [Streptomyces sp. RP5T]
MTHNAQSPLLSHVLLAPQKSAEQVRAFFADHGFEVGEVVATGFALTGPRSAYLETFGTDPGAARPDELPLGRLPREIAAGIAAVVLPAPPDFGPTSY